MLNGGPTNVARPSSPSTVLRSFRASFAGITVNSVSLIFIVAGGLIFASGVRAFAALPGTNVS